MKTFFIIFGILAISFFTYAILTAEKMEDHD